MLWIDDKFGLREGSIEFPFRMASEYALPAGGRHAYSHSYSSVHLSPGKAAANGFTHSNGSPGKLSVSNSPLFTHTESSRETSPIHLPNGDGSHFKHLQSFEQNAPAFRESSRTSRHKHNHSEPPMKGRSRGESDLGRPAQRKDSVYQAAMHANSKCIGVMVLTT